MKTNNYFAVKSHKPVLSMNVSYNKQRYKTCKQMKYLLSIQDKDKIQLWQHKLNLDCPHFLVNLMARQQKLPDLEIAEGNLFHRLLHSKEKQQDCFF
jgi:hypothetical protein